MKEESVKFQRILGSKGGVLGISIPPELQTYLEAKDGDMLTLAAYNGKHGKYIAIWK